MYDIYFNAKLISACHINFSKKIIILYNNNNFGRYCRGAYWVLQSSFSYQIVPQIGIAFNIAGWTTATVHSRVHSQLHWGELDHPARMSRI